MAEKQKSKQRFGKSNWRWKWWKSSDYRRRITKAKNGEIIHHKDENKNNNSKSNFAKVKWTWAHNKLHPEKAVKGGKARARQRK